MDALIWNLLFLGAGMVWGMLLIGGAQRASDSPRLRRRPRQNSTQTRPCTLVARSRAVHQEQPGV
jgi:hypothetical protein